MHRRAILRLRDYIPLGMTVMIDFLAANHTICAVAIPRISFQQTLVEVSSGGSLRYRLLVIGKFGWYTERKRKWYDLEGWH